MNLHDYTFANKAGRLLLRILLGIISFFLLLFFFWSLLIRGPFLIVFALLLILVFLPLMLKSRHYTITRIILSAFAIILIIMFTDLPVREVQSRFNRLAHEVRTDGPASLSFIDKLTVYHTNIIMSLSGRLLGFPEYSRQSWRLCTGGGAQHSWHSDFALKSPKVAGVFRNWTVLLERQRRDVSYVSLPARFISWQNTQEDRRVALALNPVRLEAKACPVGQRWRFDCRATTRMKYGKSGARVIISVADRQLMLPEAPFWALQQAGWLKPFTAVWEWSFFSDDKRLESAVVNE